MVTPQPPPPPTLQRLGWENALRGVALWPGLEGAWRRVGQQAPTCLGSQHEGGVAFFVLSVHVQERAAAEQGHHAPEAAVAGNHEACLGEGPLSLCSPELLAPRAR